MKPGRIAAMGRAPRWTPYRLGSKLKYWWHAGYGVTAPGNRVSQWDSLVGGVSFVQATGAKQPLYEASRWNHLPTIGSDDGARGMRTSTSITLTRPYTIGLLASGGSGGMLYELSDNAVANATGGSWLNGANSPAIANLGTSSSSKWSYFNYTYGSFLDAVSTSAVPNGYPKSIIHHVGATHATHTVTVAGQSWPLTLGLGNNPGAVASVGNLSIFSRAASGNDFNAPARIAELVGAEGLTAAEETQLDLYLRQRGALTHQVQQCWLGDSILGNGGAAPSPVTVRSLCYPNETDHRVIDLSVYGEQLTHQKTRWDNVGGGGAPKGFSGLQLVLIEAGINDAANGASASTVLARMQGIIDDVRAANLTVFIVVVKLSPTASVDNTVRTTINTGIDGLTSVNKVVSSHLAILDNGSGGLQSQYHLPGDNTHLSLLGEQVLATAITTDALVPLGLAA